MAAWFPLFIAFSKRVSYNTYSTFVFEMSNHVITLLIFVREGRNSRSVL